VTFSGAVLLTLDHLIIRTADPETTLKELAERLDAPVLAEVEEVSGLASGIVRTGDVDTLDGDAEPFMLGAVAFEFSRSAA
jgi:hypothetical protein